MRTREQIEKINRIIHFEVMGFKELTEEYMKKYAIDVWNGLGEFAEDGKQRNVRKFLAGFTAHPLETGGFIDYSTVQSCYQNIPPYYTNFEKAYIALKKLGCDASLNIEATDYGTKDAIFSCAIGAGRYASDSQPTEAAAICEAIIKHLKKESEICL